MENYWNFQFLLVAFVSAHSAAQGTQEALDQIVDWAQFSNGHVQRARMDLKKPKCTHDIDIVRQLVDIEKTGYNKHKLPKPGGMKVKIDMWIQAITSISENTQDFEVDLYINEMWEDPRLRFDHLNPCKANMSVDNSFLEKIWTPNTCFINSKEAFIHRSPFTNIFLMIYNNGTVWCNYRVRLIGPCQMELQRFPMDTQMCSLTFESFNYNIDEVRMIWSEQNPISILGSTELPDFTLINAVASAAETEYPAGWWDELTITFVFKRRYGWYIFQGYIPTYLIIVISWISFHLGTMALPARTMLGVNALLAMTFQFGNIISNLPRVSYIKAIDVWMLSGMTFIFASLIELAVVGRLAHLKMCRRRCEQGDSSWQRSSPIFWPKKSINNAASPAGERPEERSTNDWIKPLPLIGGSLRDVGDISYTYQDLSLNKSVDKPIWRTFAKPKRHYTPEDIDKLSAIIFPVVFLLFNIFYWGYYMGYTKSNEPNG